MRISIVVITLLLSSLTYAQHTNFNTQRNWSLNKKELVFGFGATQFTGDLGGRDNIGKDFSLVDMDFPATGFGCTPDETPPLRRADDWLESECKTHAK